MLGFRVGFLVLVETARLRGMSCCVPTFSAAGLSVLSTMRRGSARGKQPMAGSGLRLPGGEVGAGGPDRSGWQRYSRRKVWSSAAGGLRDMAVAQGAESSAVSQLQAVLRTPEASTPMCGAGGAAGREENSSGWRAGGAAGPQGWGWRGALRPEGSAAAPGLRPAAVLSPKP